MVFIRSFISQKRCKIELFRIIFGNWQ